MWIYTVLTYNFIHFPAELIISEAVFLIQKKRKDHYGIRLVCALILYFFLVYGWFALINPAQKGAFLSIILLYLGYAVLMALPILCCYEMDRLELLFAVVGGYATQHMCFTALRIILYAKRHSLDVQGGMHFITQYLIYIVWAAMIYFLVVRKNQDKNDFKTGDVRIAVFALVLVLAAVVISVFYSYPEDEANIYNCVLCPAYGFLCCAMVLAMEYYILRENRMKKDQEIMEQMLQMANGQQKSTQEAIDIINIKCHDLKHQIRALAKIENAEARSEYLKEVQEAVSIYDATYHTGCRVLDYILREKSLMFNEYQVEFSCMAEGEGIGFMSISDIYALMGNALDNALQCVIREAENERVISLQIRTKGDMLFLHLENRCSHILEFRDGFPVTDKKDKDRHGFGVKSIRYIAEKYNGQLFMEARNGQFILDMFFPLQAKNG